ncbi:sugar phosphate isomerase/epimerase [Granulicella sp. WH15]|uniref:TIM barrel protein n=1 Tax=Granulicella sp. WH15 TaxID=2602070 RepID=UPI001366AABD|nr:TIM barrel protein [Granulicella sp. WH15]QHN03210.1 sugar phosphate isomerase/epimerase [Granulicella sp. WH15]
MWPGLVGKGTGSEPPLSFDTMLELTAAAEVDGVRFDGIDLILTAPHVDIDSTEDDLKRLSDKIVAKELSVGSLVAPVWPDLGGGSAMGNAEENARFLTQVEKSCRIGHSLRKLGIRSPGVIRIDSATPPSEWVRNPEENTKQIAHTFREACLIAEGYGERLAAEGEICWAGMHTWRRMVELLELVGRPEILGFQADMAHTMLFTLGYNAPEDRLLPEDFVWSEQELFAKAIAKMADALRPWTIDFHVAQNDGTVKGSGAHDRTGRHCLPNDPEGRMNIVRDAGAWMRDGSGHLTKTFHHICWDGCMFSNDVMLDSRTWNDVLGAMMKVRAAHGWD